MAVRPSARKRSTVGGPASHLLGSVVVAGAANVLVDQQRRFGAGGRGAFAAVLQNGGDRGVGSRAKHQRASAGRIDALGTIAFDQAQDADAGAETLLGVRPRAQNDIDEHGGVGTDRLGLMADALMGPVAIAPVGAGHVLGDRTRPMWAQAAAMAGDPFAAMKDLDCRGGDARLDLLAEQLMRHAVVMLADLDVAALPFGIFVGQRRQRSERGFVKLLEKSPPAGAPAAHQAIVQLIEQSTDRSV